MKVPELLNRLAAANVTLYAREGAVAWRGPKGAVTPLLRDTIRSHKAALLVLLAEAAPPRPFTLADFLPPAQMSGNVQLPTRAQEEAPRLALDVGDRVTLSDNGQTVKGLIAVRQPTGILHVVTDDGRRCVAPELEDLTVTADYRPGTVVRATIDGLEVVARVTSVWESGEVLVQTLDGRNHETILRPWNLKPAWLIINSPHVGRVCCYEDEYDGALPDLTAYARSEIEKLQGLDVEALQAVQELKSAFGGVYSGPIQEATT